MKKLIALLMVLCFSFTMLAGCGSKDEEEDKKPKIVKGDMFDMLEAMANTKSGVTKADRTTDRASRAQSRALWIPRSSSAASDSMYRWM